MRSIGRILCILLLMQALLADITVSGNPAAMVVNSAIAGSNTNDVINSSTTYSLGLVLNLSSSITGAVNTSVPSQTTLSVQLAAPTGGTSAGKVSLTTTAKNLVTGIPLGTHNNLAITYTWSAPVAAGVVSSTTRIVTFTLLSP